MFNTPVTSFSYTVTGGSYILQDLLLSTPGPPSSIPTGFVLLGVVNPAITGPVPCAKAQSEDPDGNLRHRQPGRAGHRSHRPGARPFLQLARTYNSQDAASATGPDAAGFGWFHSYAASLTLGGGGNATVCSRAMAPPFRSSPAARFYCASVRDRHARPELERDLHFHLARPDEPTSLAPPASSWSGPIAMATRPAWPTTPPASWCR